MATNMLSESLKLRRCDAQDQSTQIQLSVTPSVLQHKSQCYALKKQHTEKNKEEAAEYTKLLAKRVKGAKENHQEQTAKRRRPPSLRASPSRKE